MLHIILCTIVLVVEVFLCDSLILWFACLDDNQAQIQLWRRETIFQQWIWQGQGWAGQSSCTMKHHYHRFSYHITVSVTRQNGFDALVRRLQQWELKLVEMAGRCHEMVHNVARERWYSIDVLALLSVWKQREEHATIALHSKLHRQNLSNKHLPKSILVTNLTLQGWVHKLWRHEDGIEKIGSSPWPILAAGKGAMNGAREVLLVDLWCADVCNGNVDKIVLMKKVLEIEWNCRILFGTIIVWDV